MTLITTQWKKVSAEEAAKSPYYGFNGLLIVFYVLAIALIVGPVRSLVGGGAGTARMFGPENAAIIRESYAIRLALLLPFLVLAPLKHRLMPQITIACYWASFFVFVGAILLTSDPARRLTTILFSATVAVVYTAYLMFSKRVNATYHNRVPADMA